MNTMDVCPECGGSVNRYGEKVFGRKFTDILYAMNEHHPALFDFTGCVSSLLGVTLFFVFLGSLILPREMKFIVYTLMVTLFVICFIFFSIAQFREVYRYRECKHCGWRWYRPAPISQGGLLSDIITIISGIVAVGIVFLFIVGAIVGAIVGTMVSADFMTSKYNISDSLFYLLTFLFFLFYIFIVWYVSKRQRKVSEAYSIKHNITFGTTEYIKVVVGSAGIVGFFFFLIGYAFFNF